MNRNRSSVSEIASLLARLAIGLLALPLLGAIFMGLARAEPVRAIPAPSFDPRGNASSETAVLAGGCFWGLQGVFEHVKGVTKVVSGYSGGAKGAAEYETVSSGNTGHAESVQITFDSRQVSYGEILRVFFSVAHDPTQLNRQGPDEGTQYRSEIFFTSPAQEKVAKTYIAQLEKAQAFSGPIVTRVESVRGFYPAEAYHQDYLLHHPDSLYIQVNDLPKIERLKTVYPRLYAATPVTVTALR
ncbi:MAG: peptide-methionine (S)-S-oxide reductase MsrA [Alphaproteobacteria bacterium]|nr:peptide-methionine (S)-S-oxide reductase MsrA [Alphaproteobacteria bacterium]